MPMIVAMSRKLVLILLTCTFIHSGNCVSISLDCALQVPYSVLIHYFGKGLWLVKLLYYENELPLCFRIMPGLA